jgi:hypothetical protein
MIKKYFIKNKLVNSMEFMTQFAGGLISIQYVIVSIVFVKKI